MTKKKKKHPRPERPLPLKWEFPEGTPTYDYIEDHHLGNMWELQEAVENFIHKMEDGQFLAWEAVVANEQALPLTKKQEAALEELLDFSDGEEERVLYIDDIPRTSEPWYAILNKLVPYLLIEPFRTADVPDEVQCEGWRNLVECLAKHGNGLSLPSGATFPEEVVPLELRHKLWLQDCFDALSGLGQDEELTLERNEQQDRIDEFIDCLREHKDSVQYFNLTLDSLLERVILPERDRPIFVRLMQEKLGMKATTEKIADYLLDVEQLKEGVRAGLISVDRLSDLIVTSERELQATKQTVVETEQEIYEAKRRIAELEAQLGSLPKEEISEPFEAAPTTKKVGRNDPCPCGSGKKFKKCCMKKQGV
ncbi:MAG: SEC-C metal-binding domain-containing protein [Thermoguttaceae bacterium]